MALVPPTVADANAQAALDAAVDLPGGPANVRVTRSAKRLKFAEGFLATGAITEAEYGNHEGFHSRCVAAATAGGGGAPAWFAPALAAGLAAGLAPINARLDTIDARLDTIDARLHTIDANLMHFAARQQNAVAVHQNDLLAPLNDAAGNPGPNFPATLQALNNMNGTSLTAILNHYNLAVGGTVEIKRDRFKKFIGIHS